MIFVDRGVERVLHRAVHSGDAAQDVQPRSAGLSHVAVQSVRLFRRALQYSRGDLQLQRSDAGTWRQRAALCQATARLQSYPVCQLACQNYQNKTKTRMRLYFSQFWAALAVLYTCLKQNRVRILA